MSANPRGNVVRAGALLAVASLALTACSSSSNSATPSTSAIGKDHAATTLSLWTAWAGDDAKSFQKMVDACTAQYPWMTVKVVQKPDGLGQATLAAVTAGNPPDSVEYRDAESLGQAATNNVLTPIDDYVARDGLNWGDFAPGAEKMGTYDGKHYTLPYAFDVYGLYYNKDLLAQAGMTQPPQTLADFNTLNDKLTTKNADGSLKTVGFLPDYEGSYITLYGPLFGGKSYSPDGKTVIVTSTDGWEKALEWQKTFYDKYGADALKKFKAGFGEYDSARHPWLHGDVSSVFEGEWLARYPKTFGNGNPKNWGFAPMPGPNGIDTAAPFTGLSGNSFAIPHGAKHPEEAWALNKCLATNAAPLAAFNDSVANISSLKAAAALSTLVSDPAWKAMTDLSQSSGAVPPNSSPIGDPVGEAMGQLEEKYLAGKVPDLKAALATLQTQVQAQIDSQAGP